MNSRISMLSFLAGLCWLASGDGQQTSKEKYEDPRRRLERIFKETSPAAGQRLPDVTAYDARGRKFELRRLTGHYTVLTFGCLT